MRKVSPGQSSCPYFTERETEAQEPEPLVQECSDSIGSIQPPLAQDWSGCDIPGVPVPPTLRCACIQDSPGRSTSGEPHSRLLGTWQRPGAGSPASSCTIASRRRGATGARTTQLPAPGPPCCGGNSSTTSDGLARALLPHRLSTSNLPCVLFLHPPNHLPLMC